MDLSVLLPIQVRILREGLNQQVTNVYLISKKFSKLVGTSETSRATCNNETQFNQWLAGLIDGDGSLLVSKKGYTSCEITLSSTDERTLRMIQNKLGGSIKLRAGVKAFRWRLHNKPGMLALVARINGYIRHTSRLKQLHHVCHVLNISPILPDTLHSSHGWFSGFFDAEGTIGISHKGPNERPQLTISVSNKLHVDVAHFMSCLSGNVYYDRSQNGTYKWSIQSQTDILKFVDYMKECPSRTSKMNRIHLISTYYQLVAGGLWKKDPTTAQFSRPWEHLLQKWEHKLFKT